MDHHVDPGRAQFEAFKALPRNARVAMINLLRFRASASYPAEHPLASAGLSGAEAYKRYGSESGPVFGRVGGKLVWSARPELVLIGPAEERWDAAFVASYPSAAAFLDMITDPVYRQAVMHRQAAVETSRLIRTAPHEGAPAFG